jgi:hypothetical protein
MDRVVGQRVCREEAPNQIGTVTEVNRSDMKVVWDNGGISFFQLTSGYVPLRAANEQ